MEMPIEPLPAPSFNHPHVGTVRVMPGAVFVHLTAWIGVKHADELVKVGECLIQAAAALRSQSESSWRDRDVS